LVDGHSDIAVDDASTNHDDLLDHERHGHRRRYFLASLTCENLGKRVMEKRVGTLGFNRSVMRDPKRSV
jgi:hypothetical protein